MHPDKPLEELTSFELITSWAEIMGYTAENVPASGDGFARISARMRFKCPPGHERKYVDFLPNPLEDIRAAMDGLRQVSAQHRLRISLTDEYYMDAHPNQIIRGVTLSEQRHGSQHAVVQVRAIAGTPAAPIETYMTRAVIAAARYYAAHPE